MKRGKRSESWCSKRQVDSFQGRGVCTTTKCRSADVEGCGEARDEQLAQLPRTGVGENSRENADVFAMGQNVAEGGITDDVAEMSMWQRLVVLSVDWLAAQAAEGPSLPP